MTSRHLFVHVGIKFKMSEFVIEYFGRQRDGGDGGSSQSTYIKQVLCRPARQPAASHATAAKIPRYEYRTPYSSAQNPHAGDQYIMQAPIGSTSRLRTQASFISAWDVSLFQCTRCCAFTPIPRHITPSSFFSHQPTTSPIQSTNLHLQFHIKFHINSTSLERKQTPNLGRKRKIWDYSLWNHGSTPLASALRFITPKWRTAEETVSDDSQCWCAVRRHKNAANIGGVHGADVRG